MLTRSINHNANQSDDLFQEDSVTMDEDQMNDRLLKIFFPKYQEIHKIIGTRIQAWEEEAYGWLDGVLEEASKAFGK